MGDFTRCGVGEGSCSSVGMVVGSGGDAGTCVGESINRARVCHDSS